MFFPNTYYFWIWHLLNSEPLILCLEALTFLDLNGRVVVLQIDCVRLRKKIYLVSFIFWWPWPQSFQLQIVKKLAQKT